MNGIVDALSKNSWVTVSSTMFGFVSLIIGIIFYFKSKKVKKLNTAICSINLFKDTADKIDGLEILYSQASVPNVTITKLALWNGGNEIINSDDIATADPLVIMIKDDFKILEAKVIYVKNKTNTLVLDVIKSGKQISVNFDYLDKQEGGVIQILHTGNSSSEIELTGTIKGAEKVNVKCESNIEKNRIVKFISRVELKSRRIMGFVMVAMGILLPILIYLPQGVTISKISIRNENTISFLITTFLCGLYIYIGCTNIKQQVPKGFEIFEENI